METVYELKATEAGKALSQGLSSKHKLFSFDGHTYLIISEDGFLDMDSESKHKHYRFGNEAINFYVQQLV